MAADPPKALTTAATRVPLTGKAGTGACSWKKGEEGVQARG